MRLAGETLIPGDAIQQRVAELGAEISRDYEGRALLLLVVLKGSVFFAADLMRHIDLDVFLDFIGAKSYVGADSQGTVYFTKLPDEHISGRHVLVVEDILDSGRTSAAILAWLEDQSPASVALCALLDKPSRRVEELTPNYVGFTIDDHFVVGYGLDYNQRYRQLPSIYTLKEI